MARFPISGASIAGLALAYWLLKGGYDVASFNAPRPRREAFGRYMVRRGLQIGPK